MARTTERLTAVEVTNLKTAGLYPDGAGLYLKITPTGTKSWIFRFKRGKVAHDMGLGPVGTVGLAKARKLASEARRQRLEGLDPIEARKAQRAAKRLAEVRSSTFKQCAEELIASHEAGWRNAKHRQQWRNTLKTYAYPILGDLAIGEIDTDVVLQVLQQKVTVASGETAPLWNAKTETAGRIRGRSETVLSWAKAKGLRDGENVAAWRGHLDRLLPARSKVRRVEHHPALPYAELPELMTRLRDSTSISARALEFTILTAARTGEALGATFDEFDPKAKVWTVPGSRMKGGIGHRVPLSPRAIAIVKEMAEIKISKFVFPGVKSGRPLTDMALLMLLRDLRPGITTHGFRSTFKDWASEMTGFPDFVSEAALAHVSADKVRAAYARSDLFAKRRELMEAWTNFCGRQPAKVLPMRRQRVS
jgi:integrase